jgi:GDP-L-fucose synthase
VKRLVETITYLTGFAGKIVWDTGKPNGQPRRCLDTSRAAQLFAFCAKTSLEEGLSRTIAWYQYVLRVGMLTAG